MTLIFPVACDLDKRDGKLVAGFESACSCRKAYEVSSFMTPDSYLFVPAAREAPDTEIAMSKVMGECLIEMGVDGKRVLSLVAESFNTEGEVLAIIAYIKQSLVHFDEIIICCKWWHMPRTWALMRFHLWMADIKIRVRIKCCRSKAKMRAIVMEFIGAWPKNVLRICHRKLTTGTWS